MILVFGCCEAEGKERERAARNFGFPQAKRALSERLAPVCSDPAASMGGGVKPTTKTDFDNALLLSDGANWEVLPLQCSRGCEGS